MIDIRVGDCRDVLKTLPDESVHCVVTSPPYFGLRDYGHVDQIGLESSPAQFIATMVEVFREVKRVLRSDGTLWLNLGDAYYSPRWNGGVGANSTINSHRTQAAFRDAQRARRSMKQTGASAPVGARNRQRGLVGFKPKDLMMMPARVAIALQEDGWYLRQDIIWSKPNPMPESVRDRCTKAHEYIFLLSKSPRYYYELESILEPVSEGTHARLAQDIEKQIGSSRVPGKTNGPMKAVARKRPTGWANSPNYHDANPRFKGRKLAQPGSGVKNNSSFDAAMAVMPTMRNKRSVWEITTRGFSGAHFATFPPELPEICIKAGCPGGGVVLDPFGGAGTVGLVAARLQRSAILIELNPKYAEMARRRIHADAPLFSEVRA